MEAGWHRLCAKYTNHGETPAPYGWLQWKGTDVCMDFHCKCGEQTHLDTDFTYLIQCGKCKRVYWPNAHVTMLELEGQDRIDALESDPKETQ